MRKYIAVVVAVGFMSIFTGSAHCESDLHALPLTLNVQGNWGLQFNPAATSLNFGSLKTGVESAPVILNVEAKANHGMPWTVVLQANPITHVDGVTQIPAPNFTFFQTYDNPDAVETPVIGTSMPVPASELVVFEPAAALYNTQFTGFGLGFIIVTPPEQKAGDYTTVVNVRMVDGF